MHVLIIFLITFILGLPTPTSGKRVHDFDDLLPYQLADQLEHTLRQVERETTAQVAVVSVTSLDGMTVDEYAFKLFKAWGIGQRNVNNGILLLVARNERRMRIEVGYGLEPLFTDSVCGEIRDTFLIPNFKLADYPEGIKLAVNEIVRILRAYPDAARGIKGSAPTYVSTPKKNAELTLGATTIAAFILLCVSFYFKHTRKYPTSIFIAGLLLLVGLTAFAFHLGTHLSESLRPMGWLFASGGSGMVALFSNVRSFNRFRQRKCSKCSTYLSLLDEKRDDAKLTEAQRLEEKIGSVDYDVWICPSCLSHDTIAYISSFSSFKVCSSCSHRTYKEVARTVVYPTTYSTGLREYSGTCVSCHHKGTRTEVISRISESSSSSSSSSSGGSSGGSDFGGGSSGGGGASGGW